MLVLLVAVGLAGCVLPEALVVQPPQAPAPAPLTTPATIHPYLQAALAHTPATSENFAFTNWTILKEVGGVPDLTSADSLDERIAFMRTLAVEEQAIATAFGQNYFLTHAGDWGWDSTDLLWEASFTLDGPPVYLLRFGDDFDFAPVLDRFDEHGYTRTDCAGTPLYSHEMDLRASWLRTTELAILNIAFIEEEKLFVLASAPDPVMAVLDAPAEGSTLASLPAVRSVAAALGDVGSAILAPFGCQPLDVARLGTTPEQIEAMMSEMRQSGISGLYTVFALGYRPATRNGAALPLGVFVHHYPSAEQAKADLEPRRRLAETGRSLVSERPYAELFEVVEAEVVKAEGAEDSSGGANLILSLRARERPPQLFFTLYYQRDLLFSVCGGF
jgi:hypothetical protein